MTKAGSVRKRLGPSLPACVLLRNLLRNEPFSARLGPRCLTRHPGVGGLGQAIREFDSLRPLHCFTYEGVHQDSATAPFCEIPVYSPHSLAPPTSTCWSATIPNGRSDAAENASRSSVALPRSLGHDGHSTSNIRRRSGNASACNASSSTRTASTATRALTCRGRHPTPYLSNVRFLARQTGAVDPSATSDARIASPQSRRLAPCTATRAMG